MSDSSSSIKRILVPLDINRLSEGKLPASEVQAKAFGADIVLLHVISATPPSDAAVTVAESQALTYLDAIAARLRSDGIEAHSLLRYGPVADTIVEEISQQNADLVVIGSNVRRGFSRLLLGSVVEDVVARAPCPVLLVRPDIAAAEKFQPVRSFDDDVARAGAVSPRSVGLRTVEVARIVGSVGRAAEMDESFRVKSRSRNEQQRFEKILALMESGASLPPLALYKLGYGYYVLDGNHRVAAAKQIGQLEVEAEITEFVPLRDPESQRVFVERRAFERNTGLTRVGAAQPGNYKRLDDMVREFQRERDVNDIYSAARLWEQQVYRPVARRIRALRLTQYFPGQRTADIFVQLYDYRQQVAENGAPPPEWEEAVQHFREHRGQAGG